MRYYELVMEQQRGPYTVIVDRTYEDIHPQDCFDDSCYDIKEICRKIDMGLLEWFMLRTRVLYEGVELAEEFLGGLLYDDPNEVLTDGTAEDQIYQALENAKKAAVEYKRKFEILTV
jgi:hypothetical protein